MGFGRSQFQDMHFSSQQARNRASGVYSDDEYESMAGSDKRTKPKSGGTSGGWRHDARAGQGFWEDHTKRTEGESGQKYKEDFAKKVWDEFDDFFDFNDSTQRTKRAEKDETKGADYKADLEIEFVDAFKGVKTVSFSFLRFLIAS